MAGHEALRAKLEQLIAEGTRRIRSQRVARTLPFALYGTLELAARMALIAAIVLIGAWIFGRPASPWAFLLTIAFACTVLALFVILRARLLPVRRGDALALWDRGSGLEDRLLAADEFLRSEEAAAAPGEELFIAAAIEDAACHVERATEAVQAARREAIGIGPSLLRAILAFGILAATAWLPGASGADDSSEEATLARSEAPIGVDVPPQNTPPGEVPVAQAPPESERGATPKASAPSEAQSTDAGPGDEQTRESVGATGQGKSADARSASRQGAARGAPSGQSQTSKGRAKELTQRAKKPILPQPPAEEGRPKPKEDVSGSTAGQGSAKGSARNPAATDWSSKDQVSTPDDAEIEEDQETEDEEERQESRGGIQPALRDRRPPVSRDLSIGFGNRPNPDANGRGGPSAPKKSRGVASLVLGVPIPDRVKGQPGPGKTKITQERIEPREEETQGAQAGDRGTRQGTLAPLDPLPANPWMRQLMRRYFRARSGDA